MVLFPVGERNVPLLGMERSHGGNGVFPYWERFCGLQMLTLKPDECVSEKFRRKIAHLSRNLSKRPYKRVSEDLLRDEGQNA